MTGRVKILYIDDEQGNIDYFKTVFRREFDILAANSGDSGLVILEENPDVSIIFTDQRMPKMTGIEFLKKAMEITPDPIRILVTGYADMETVIKAINQGHIFFYISKPWSYDEMKIIIGRAMETQRLKQAHQELLARAERKEKEMIISELESLRRQVNPHFLFNCLNTLHALVNQNPEAREFVKRLSGIYRQMLEHNKFNMVKLEEELAFCENYFYLQNVRFQGAIEFVNKLQDGILKMFVPSAALQLLIENAVKHNIVTRDQPLRIDLYSEGDWLVVKNNFQLKKMVDSTGMGHENLIKRYAFVTDMKPEFYLDDGFYYAKIPLLNETF